MGFGSDGSLVSDEQGVPRALYTAPALSWGLPLLFYWPITTVAFFFFPLCFSFFIFGLSFKKPISSFASSISPSPSYLYPVPFSLLFCYSSCCLYVFFCLLCVSVRFPPSAFLSRSGHLFLFLLCLQCLSIPCPLCLSVILCLSLSVSLSYYSET